MPANVWERSTRTYGQWATLKTSVSAGKRAQKKCNGNATKFKQEETSAHWQANKQETAGQTLTALRHKLRSCQGFFLIFLLFLELHTHYQNCNKFLCTEIIWSARLPYTHKNVHSEIYESVQEECAKLLYATRRQENVTRTRTCSVKCFCGRRGAVAKRWIPKTSHEKENVLIAFCSGWAGEKLNCFRGLSLYGAKANCRDRWVMAFQGKIEISAIEKLQNNYGLRISLRERGNT